MTPSCLRAAAVTLCVSMLLSACCAQFGGMPKKDKIIIPARKEDLKYMKCAACEALVKQTIRLTNQMREESPKGKELEADLLETMELMCNPDLEQGEWLNYLTIKHEGDKLKVVDMGQMGQCDVECRTISRACADILEDTDITEYSPLLVKGASRSELSQFMCYDSTGVCGKKVPAVPKDRAPGKPFKPMDEDEVQRYRMMRNMKKNGMSGTMYDRDSILQEMEALKEEYGDDFPEEFEQDMIDARAEVDKDAEVASGDDAGSGGLSSGIGKVVSGVVEGAKKVYDNIVGGKKEKEDL